MDITKHKRDICAIANINTGKSLVYQSVTGITGVSILVILPIIALIEDQVCIAPKMLYYYHLYLVV